MGPGATNRHQQHVHELLALFSVAIIATPSLRHDLSSHDIRARLGVAAPRAGASAHLDKVTFRGGDMRKAGMCSGLGEKIRFFRLERLFLNGKLCRL
jgi:hypothetical protein